MSCENTKLICENTKLICENTKLICENTKLICEITKLICENTKLIYENSKYFTKVEVSLLGFHKKGHFTSKEKGTFCVIFNVGGGGGGLAPQVPTPLEMSPLEQTLQETNLDNKQYLIPLKYFPNEERVCQKLTAISVTKYMGPNEIPNWVLRDSAYILAYLSLRSTCSDTVEGS